MPAGLVCPAGHAFDDDAGRFCPACGLPLTRTDELPALSRAAERARKVSPQLGEGRLVKVGWARNLAEAEFLAGMLLEEGVPAVVRRGIAVDVPDLIAAGPRDILVAESGVDVARDVLKPVAGTEERPPLPRARRPLWVRVLAILIVGALLVVAIVGAAVGTAGLAGSTANRVDCDALTPQRALDVPGCPR